MSSNYTFCGYDMMDPNSKAGRSGEGINLNSVTVQYNLKNNPDLCRMIYEGIVPSMYGNGPTVTDLGTGTIDDLPTVMELNEKGDVTNVNPAELAMAQNMPVGQIPVAQFSGAMSPMFHDNAQPTYSAGPIVPNPYMTQPTMGYQQPMAMNGFMPINYMPYGVVQYDYNPVNPTTPIPRDPNGDDQAIREWNDYQRTKGFRAPIPTDTDFPEFGLLSGFHRGFNPHAVHGPTQDEFYDITLGGRRGISRRVMEEALRNAAGVWGYQPGDVVDIREQMMFPGINNNHNDPTPSNNPVINPNGTVQRRLTGSANVPNYMMAYQLPVSNIVATNPYMAGCNVVGGYNMNPPMYGPTPTPYMQARYNYAIACGFQSIQEMDDNDFVILKMCSRIANHDMTDEEFDEHFENCWCKRFTDMDELRNPKTESNRSYVDHSYTKVKVTLRRGDEILAGVDCNDPKQYRNHCELMRTADAARLSPQQEAQIKQFNENLRIMKDQLNAWLYMNAPERKYDHRSMLDFMRHGIVESKFHYLNQRAYLDRIDPKKRMQVDKIDETGFIKRCLENGVGLPAENARIDMENRMFYVGQTHPDEMIGNKPRGSYGVKANGEDLNINTYPMYGYATYIPDPENPSIAIPFPRQFIEDTYNGYTRYCGAINTKSKKLAVPMPYEDFKNRIGVRIVDNEEFIDKYSHIPGTDEYIESALKGMERDNVKVPLWALGRTPDEQDYIEQTYGDDVPLDELQRGLEEDSD